MGKNFKNIKSCVAAFVAAAFVLTGITPARASAGHIMLPSGAVSLPVIRGLQFNPSEPLNFNFVLDLADQDTISEEEALKLVRYFLAALVVPTEDVWVNLSPDGQERIIAENFAATEAGRDLLQQDLILKKLSASFLHPDGDLGRKFWDTAYAKMYQIYGITEIPQDSFQRIWIVPEHAVIDEFKNAAYISESRLKVLMADEYESFKSLDAGGADISSDAHGRVSAIMKEIVVPEIEKQVNEGEHFAVLRQVYHSMILAIWFKNKLKNHWINQAYSNTSKVEGIDLVDPADEQKTFDSYLEIFQKGLYDEVREDYDPVQQSITYRKYVSGGYVVGNPDEWMESRPGKNYAMLSRGKAMLLTVSFLLLSAAANVFANNDLKRVGTITSDHQPTIEQLQQYVTLNDVVGLNGQVNPVTGRTYNIDTEYITRNWNNIWDSKTYGWAQEAVTVAAEHKLAKAGHKMHIDGHIDDELRNALAQENQKAPNPQLPGGTGVDTSRQAPSGGVFAPGSYRNLDQEFQAETDGIYKSFPETNYADSLRQLHWTASFQVQSQKDNEQDSLLLKLLNDSTSTVAPSPPPPPDTPIWTLSLYNDFGVPFSGNNSTWSSYQYGVFGLNYTKGPLSVFGNLETAGVFADGSFTGTVGPYAGASYVVNDQWKIGAQRRFGAKGVTPVIILNADYTSPNGYTLSGAVSLTNNFDETLQEWKRRQAYVLSTSGNLGKFFVQPYLYTMSDGGSDYYTDFGLFVSYPLSNQSSISFERNTSAMFAMYGYAPNLPLRLNYSWTSSNGQWTLAPYLTSNDYNFKWNNLGFGVAAKRTFTNASGSSSSTTTLPAFNANFYTDGWWSKPGGWGQYGQYALNGTFGQIGYTGLFETAVTGVMDDNNVLSYVSTTALYNELAFPLFQGPVSTTLKLGHRSNVLGGINPVNYVRAGGNTRNNKLAYDIWYSRTRVANAETGATENVQAKIFNITYAPTPWLTIAPTLVTGTQGDEPFRDAGGKVTATHKGYQYSVEYNPTLGPVIGLTPNQKFRVEAKSPTWTVNTTSETAVNVQVSGYVATNDVQNFTGIMPGATVNVSLAPKPQGQSFHDFMKDSTLSLMRLANLPAGVSTSNVNVGGNLDAFDVDLLKFAGGKLTRQDFVEHFGSNGAAVKRWKKFRRAFRDLQNHSGGPWMYSKELSYGVEVAKDVLKETGYYSMNIDPVMNPAFRQGAYTVMMTTGSANDNPSLGANGGLNDALGQKGDKAMVAEDPAKKVGGVDLSETESLMETRVHGSFEGFKNLPLELKNPDLLRGLGVQLIQMRPIFDLGKVFSPDANPVMISRR